MTVSQGEQGPGEALRELVVSSPDGRSRVLIGSGLLPQLGAQLGVDRYTGLFVLTDANVGRHYLDVVLEACRGRDVATHTVPAGEHSKTLAVYEEIQAALARLNFDRRGLVVNLGGGVVTDLGGFVAATYRRGVAFVNISTSLEGMVDASVGGKNGVNLGRYKNYLGTFTQPDAVIVDVATLRTLDERNLTAGWAEVVKYGLIADADLYRLVTAKAATDYARAELVDIVARCCEIKRDVVQEDPTESGLRKILNFGHTVGHAIEALSQRHDPLLHGEAVAIGMVAEGYMAFRQGLVTRDECDGLRSAVSRCGLPVRAPAWFGRGEDLTDLIARDKKNFGNQVRWSLIDGIGSCRYDEVVPAGVVQAALEHVTNAR